MAEYARRLIAGNPALSERITVRIFSVRAVSIVILSFYFITVMSLYELGGQR